MDAWQALNNDIKDKLQVGTAAIILVCFQAMMQAMYCLGNSVLQVPTVLWLRSHSDRAISLFR